jgi:hypothetical protein
MGSFLRSILGRFIGAGVGAAVGYGASKGIPALTPESSAEVTRYLTDAAMLAGYGVAHVLHEKKSKPTPK